MKTGSPSRASGRGFFVVKQALAGLSTQLFEAEGNTAGQQQRSAAVDGRGGGGEAGLRAARAGLGVAHERSKGQQQEKAAGAGSPVGKK